MIEYTVKVYDSGTKSWYLDDKLHCEHGPAVEWFDGTKEWYLGGKKLTEEEHRKAVTKPTCDGKVVTIDGVKYTLKEYGNG